MNTSVLVALCFCFSVALPSFADEEKAPENLLFQAKNGTVTFNHQKHVERAKGDCKNCHVKLFPESKAPLNFKANMHRTAEASKTSCAACHVEVGAAFASKGNCARCHIKPTS